jgi:hypothetical protein
MKKKVQINLLKHSLTPFIKNKVLLLLLLLHIPFFFYSQNQIGNTIHGESENDRSGSSVSISANGSIVAIGASNNSSNGLFSGHVRVYENLNGIWTQIGDDLYGENVSEVFGTSVSLSSDGNILAIGAPRGEDNLGYVKVFKNISNNWTQIGNNILGESQGDLSGFKVSLSSNGQILAISAINNDEATGHVRIFQNKNGIWEQKGENINGENHSNRFGWSISLSSDGETIAISAEDGIGIGSHTGHVKIYNFNNGTWNQIGENIIGDIARYTFGHAVSLSSDGTIVAITNYDSQTGNVNVYENVSNNWVLIGNKINSESSEDRFGTSVSLSSDGNIVAVGAEANNLFSGYVHLYQNIDGVWTQIGEDIDGESQFSLFGSSVSLTSNGGKIAIGAVGNSNLNVSFAGHVKIYDLREVLSLKEFMREPSYSIYPNPVSKTLNIDKTDDIKKILIYNSLGIKLKEINKINSNKIDFSTYKSGIYYLKIINRNGVFKARKVIKN